MEMRRQRVKDIVDKYGLKSLTDPVPQVAGSGGAKPTQEQEDDGRFVSKYFDQVANKQYLTLFCQYNQTMFAKVGRLSPLSNLICV